MIFFAGEIRGGRVGVCVCGKRGGPNEEWRNGGRRKGGDFFRGRNPWRAGTEIVRGECVYC